MISDHVRKTVSYNHMKRARLALTAIMLFLIFALSGNRLYSQANTQPAGDFKTRMDKAIQDLRASDSCIELKTVEEIDDLVAATSGKYEERRQLSASLVSILQSNASEIAKSLACRQLAIIGTADDVPELSKLLPDEKFSHMARFTLERIPGQAAAEALRNALGRVKGKLLIGVINSLGNRRDAGVVGDLAKLLKDSDPMVATAAADTLGKIGSPACDVLAQAFDEAQPGVRSFIVRANVCCADALLAEGKRDAAVAIYDRVRAVAVPKSVRIAATRGAILARQPDDCLPLLVEQLKGTDPDFFVLGLMLVREIPGTKITEASAALLGNLPSERQVRLIQALAGRGDTAATPAVLSLTKQGDVSVRVAALLALVKLGNASMIAQIVDMASMESGDVARAAMETLANMPGRDVDDTLLTTLKKVENVNGRRVVIEALGQRYVAIATPELLKASTDANEGIRLAAINALGSTVREQDADAIMDLVVQAKAGKELTAAGRSLSTFCARSSEKQALLDKLIAALARAGVNNKPFVLAALGQIGGTKALTAVQSAVRDPDESVGDAAMRILGEWPDLEAAEGLLQIAKTSDSQKRKILALRGYVGLSRLTGLPLSEKLAMCRQAMELACRDEERKIVLGAMGGVPSVEALAEAGRYLDNTALKDEAAAAVVSISEKILRSNRTQVMEMIKRVLKITENKGILERAQKVIDRAEGKCR